MRSAHLLLSPVVLVLVLARPSATGAQAPSPQDAVDELLAADRTFAKAAATTDLVAGLTAMFAPDIVMPVPGGTFARGVEAAATALRSDAEQTQRATWTPVRGGISADGLHGFTFGFMTLTSADAATTYAKYLAYWIKRPEGWRVAAYKRTRAARPPDSRELMPPALPPRMIDMSTDERTVARYRRTLDAAERAFSDEAQVIGIGPAFVKYGSADAINLGPPDAPGVIVGSEAIGKFVGSAYPPGRPGISWSPDEVIVASSGDLGVTIGMITADAPGPDGTRRAVPFFTIWRRASPADPWRYVAE